MRLRCTLSQILFLVCFSLISADDDHLEPVIDTNKGDLSVVDSHDESHVGYRKETVNDASARINKRDLGSLAEVSTWKS